MITLIYSILRFMLLYINLFTIYSYSAYGIDTHLFCNEGTPFFCIPWHRAIVFSIFVYIVYDVYNSTIHVDHFWCTSLNCVRSIGDIYTLRICILYLWTNKIPNTWIYKYTDERTQTYGRNTKQYQYLFGKYYRFHFVFFFLLFFVYFGCDASDNNNNIF